jgi:stage II sporulation protein D
MRLRWGVFFAVFIIACDAGAALVPPNQVEHRIRVRIAEAVSAVHVRAEDLSIYSQKVSPETASSLSEWDLRCQGDRIRAISTEGAQTLDLKGPLTLVSGAGLINVDGHPYREQVRVYAVGSLCEVVNELDIEKYLVGLVNAEFSSRWNEQALEAQVVAARTYALYQVKQAHGQTYDVDATVKDQVYAGYGKEDFRAARAVDKTRGYVLTVAGQGLKPEPIKAFYHSTCAGRTELPQNVWGGSFPGFKHEVNCPYCHSSPAYSWQTEISARDVSVALQRGLRNDGVPRGWPKGIAPAQLRPEHLLDIHPGRLDESGRLAELILVISNAGKRLELALSAARFRDWIGPARVKSTAFELSSRPSAVGTAWRLQGRGNGHGVGMCQWGAKVMGERGFASAQILQHYYPDAVLRKLW